MKEDINPEEVILLVDQNNKVQIVKKSENKLNNRRDVYVGIILIVFCLVFTILSLVLFL